MVCFRMKSGETMNVFCKKNNILYASLYELCDRYGLTPDEALAHYLRRKGKKNENNLRFYYRGISAKRYCLEKRLSPNCFYRNLLKGFSIDEAIEQARLFKIKRDMTGGISLWQYCLKNKLNYREELKKQKVKLLQLKK